MRIFVRDLSAIEVKTGPRIRFSVTYADDQGEPVSTERGWTIDMAREIHPPMTRTIRGKYYAMVEPSVWLMGKLAEYWAGQEELLTKELGPKVVDITVDSTGNKVIEGGGEV